MLHASPFLSAQALGVERALPSTLTAVASSTGADSARADPVPAVLLRARGGAALAQPQAGAGAGGHPTLRPLRRGAAVRVPGITFQLCTAATQWAVVLPGWVMCNARSRAKLVYPNSHPCPIPLPPLPPTGDAPDAALPRPGPQRPRLPRLGRHRSVQLLRQLRRRAGGAGGRRCRPGVGLSGGVCVGAAQLAAARLGCAMHHKCRGPVVSICISICHGYIRSAGACR